MRPDEANLYKFHRKEVSRRQHWLCAYASSDEALQIADARTLIESFEERFLVEFQWDPIARRNCPIVRRLLGFRGARQWCNGTLSFSIRSPEIPYFSAEASRLCPTIPIMYWTSSADGGTPRRFFLKGKELAHEEIPTSHEAQFEKLVELRTGYIPGRITIDSFF
jgi:hypothetical protein